MLVKFLALAGIVGVFGAFIWLSIGDIRAERAEQTATCLPAYSRDCVRKFRDGAATCYVVGTRTVSISCVAVDQ